MNLPSHGVWCGARTFPTKCRWCCSPVYYFSCNCGCKVLFDDLGWPWPEHNCPQNAKNLGQTISIQVEREFAERALKQNQRRRNGWHPPIRRIDPLQCATLVIEGTLREVVVRFNLWEKLGLPDSIISRAHLRDLRIDAEHCHYQVTVHVENLLSEEIASYTLILDANSINLNQQNTGEIVRIRISGKKLLNDRCFWFGEFVL